MSVSSSDGSSTCTFLLQEGLKGRSPGGTEFDADLNDEQFFLLLAHGSGSAQALSYHADRFVRFKTKNKIDWGILILFFWFS